jgi:hypothetical protein
VDSPFRDLALGAGVGIAHMSQPVITTCLRSTPCPTRGPYNWTGMTFPVLVTYTFPSNRPRAFRLTAEAAAGVDPLRTAETSFRGSFYFSAEMRWGPRLAFPVGNGSRRRLSTSREQRGAKSVRVVASVASRSEAVGVGLRGRLGWAQVEVMDRGQKKERRAF